MDDFNYEKRCRLVAETLVDVTEAMMNAIEDLISLRLRTIEMTLIKDDMPIQDEWATLLTSQCRVARMAGSFLMTIGRKHGARYWNTGLRLHDELSRLSSIHSIDTAEPDTL